MSNLPWWDPFSDYQIGHEKEKNEQERKERLKQIEIGKRTELRTLNLHIKRLERKILQLIANSTSHAGR